MTRHFQTIGNMRVNNLTLSSLRALGWLRYVLHIKINDPSGAHKNNKRSKGDTPSNKIAFPLSKYL